MDFLRQHRTAFLIESILLILLGILAIALPFYATLSVSLIIGWILLLGGIVQLYKSIQAYDRPGWAISLMGAIIYIAIGAWMLIFPMRGILALTLVLAVFFILEGLAKIAFSLELKPAQNWGWLLASGIVALLMAVIIFWGWPATAFWVIGLLVGIDLIFFGVSLLALTINLPKNT